MSIDPQKQDLIDSFQQAAGAAIADLETRLASLRDKPAENATPIERKVEHCIAGFLNIVPLCTSLGEFAMASENADAYVMRLEAIQNQMSDDINPLGSIRAVSQTLGTLAARL